MPQTLPGNFQRLFIAFNKKINTVYFFICHFCRFHHGVLIQLKHGRSSGHIRQRVLGAVLRQFSKIADNTICKLSSIYRGDFFITKITCMYPTFQCI